MAARPPSGHRGTDDGNSFIADLNGEVARNVTGSVNIGEGSLNVVGFTKEWKVTTVSVGTTAVAIPTTSLTDRNTLIIWNKDNAATLYIGPANTVTADDAATTGGWEILPREMLNIDITDSIQVYAIVASGTVTVKILEAA